MLVLVLEFSKISAPTLYLLTNLRLKGNIEGRAVTYVTSSKELVAPPKRKTRVRTYSAVT